MMNISLKQNPEDYTIRHLTRKMTNTGDQQLSWNFNRASHFLVVTHPAKTPCDLEADILPWLTKNGETLLESGKKTIDGILWNIVQERKFLAANNKFTIPRGNLTNGIPYRIQIFPCDIQDDQWDIYQVEEDANVAVVPVSILMELQYRKPLFSKNQICMFRAKFDVNRLDGVLRYKPSCSRCQFPVSVESMKAAKEGWLYVWLPKGEDLTISVAPEYKDYYNIRIADD